QSKTMEKKIGEGAYGKVYRGRDKLTDEPIAIKIIPIDANEGVPSTAIREISVLKEMQYENIVRLLNGVHTEERLYLIFEYLDMDLKKHMELCPEFSKDHQLVRRFLYQMLCGVDYCHSRRVLHRDLKPQNLLISASENVIKLADFGLARAFNIPVKTLSHEQYVFGLWFCII
ncbi:cell division control protein 2 homolog A-like protein, partial [Tanacetum coccineum]